MGGMTGVRQKRRARQLAMQRCAECGEDKHKSLFPWGGPWGRMGYGKVCSCCEAELEVMEQDKQARLDWDRLAV